MASSAQQRGILAPLTNRWDRLSGAVETMLENERDQLPLWLPVSIGAGIIAWFTLPDAGWWLVFMVICAGIAMAGFAAGGGSRWVRAVTVVAVMMAFGCALIWARSLIVAAPVLDRPVVTQLSAEIVEVEPLPARGIVRIVVAPDGAMQLPPKVRINIPEDKVPDGLGEGAVVDMRVRLMPPAHPALPGSYDFARRAWFEGLGATGSALGDVRVITPASQTSTLRQRLSSHVQSRIDGPAGAIAATLATGDRGSLNENDAEAMRRSGLAHLLSISGLHVTAVVGATFLIVLRLLALSPTLANRANLMLVAAGAGALAGIGYTLLTGAEVPTVRSCVAAMLVLIALTLGREAITLRLVAAGALFVMLFWPETVLGPSFQLSFAAVTAIVALHQHPRVQSWFARREEQWWRRTMRVVASLFLTGLVVEFALMPIALFHFHKAGLYGALANVIAIPLTTFIIMPAEALALLFDAVGLGAPFWWVAEQALNLLLAIARFTSTRPGAVTFLPTMAGGVFALAALAGLWIAIFRTKIRWLGLPVLVGATIAMATTPVPDIIITGDGRHVAARTNSGEFAILRDRAGSFVRDMIGESIASEAELASLRASPDVTCSREFCVWPVGQGKDAVSIMSAVSGHYVDALELIQACKQVDIVVADRGLPRSCNPKWIKADRFALSRSGGLAIYLEERRVRTTYAPGDRHPWRRLAQTRQPWVPRPQSGD